jgi:hypothetical protein
VRAPRRDCPRSYRAAATEAAVPECRTIITHTDLPIFHLAGIRVAHTGLHRHDCRHAMIKQGAGQAGSGVGTGGGTMEMSICGTTSSSCPFELPQTLLSGMIQPPGPMLNGFSAINQRDFLRRNAQTVTKRSLGAKTRPGGGCNSPGRGGGPRRSPLRAATSSLSR